MPLLFTELDHVGVLRQAGGGRDPDPAHVAVLAELAGAGGISVTYTRGASGFQERDLRVLPGVVSPLRDSAGIDLVIVRENTEGDYSRVGGRVHVGTPAEVASQVARGTSFTVKLPTQKRRC